MKLNIAVLPGDGIGPEITQEALKVMNVIAKKFDHELNYKQGLVGAVAIDEVGEPYPQATHELCMQADSVFFGAIGHPKFDHDPLAKVRPEKGLLKMRKDLGLYANIRPTSVFSSLIDKSPLKKELIQKADFVCIRELTGGSYFGEKGRNKEGNEAYDVCIYSKKEVDRVVRLAYEYAMKRRKKLCVVDKANVMETSRLWREVAQEIEKEYPEVETEYLFVDAAAMRIITWPQGFDVIVTENMFGDILTDEASVISGSMGLMPSASIGLHTSVFEPIHGSYPQAANQNIANPLGAILSVAMMFEYTFELSKESNLIKEAVEESLNQNFVTIDLTTQHEAHSTSEVGDWIARYIESL